MRRFHHISFKHAFEGIIYVFRTQPNIRIHTLAALLVTILGFWFHITYIEWLLLLLTILLVVTTEMINTSIESMTDLLTSKHRQAAKIAKDVSAGMVLITAAGAIIIGVAIFVPYLY